MRDRKLTDCDVCPEYPIRLFSASPERASRSPHYRFENDSRSELGTSTLQYTLSGGGVFERGRKKYLLRRGQAFLFSVPERSRYYFPEGATEPWVYCWMTFSGGRAWWSDLRRRFGHVVNLNLEGEACGMIRDVAERYRSRQFRDPLHASALVYGALVALERELVSQQTADPIERAMEFIQMNFDRPWNIKEVARYYQLSREHFIREFTSRHGVAPGTLVRQLRLTRARRLIATGGFSASEVASQCGYSQLPSFSRAFRREFGLSPETYRKAVSGRGPVA